MGENEGTAFAPLVVAMSAHSPIIQVTRDRVQGANGFTLTEIMVLTAVIAIATMLGVPSFSKWYSKYQLRQAATDIQNQFNLARMVAMNRNSTVTVTVSVAGNSVLVSAVDANGTPAFAPETMMSHVVAVTGAPVTVNFSSLGLRSGGGPGNQTVTIQDDQQRSFSVIVSPAGKVTSALY